MENIQTPSQPAQTTPISSQDWQPAQYDARMQRRIERHSHNQAAGIPVWGVLLILVGVIALFGNLGIGLGWIFGLALGAWFVYLGVRHMQEGQTVNWWLVGLGLLIGLGAITTGLQYADKVIFPAVLLLVGLGILAEHYLGSQSQSQARS